MFGSCQHSASARYPVCAGRWKNCSVFDPLHGVSSRLSSMQEKRGRKEKEKCRTSDLALFMTVLKDGMDVAGVAVQSWLSSLCYLEPFRLRHCTALFH